MEFISEGIDKFNSMKNRELERQLNLRKKHESKRSIMAENEQVDFFKTTFGEKQALVENLLKQSQTMSKEELPEHFNVISKEILLLQKYVASSNLFLSNYLIQRCKDTLQSLSTRAKELEDDLLPKKKFGFKNKTKVKDIARINGADMLDSGNKKSEKDKTRNIECGFYRRSGEILTLTGSEIAKKDVSLEKLTGCEVVLKGFPSTLHLNHLNNCQIFSGPVSTSIFAENCQNCTLVIACQQLRLHASENVNIYLQVTSRAIMEDCHNIFIAPYNWTYGNIEADFKNAGLDRQVNNWRCIDDFNWLNVEKHSPHWREMEPENRVKEWT